MAPCPEPWIGARSIRSRRTRSLLGGHRYHYLDEGSGPSAAAGPRQSHLVVLLAELVLALRGRYRVSCRITSAAGCRTSRPPGAIPTGWPSGWPTWAQLIEQLDLRQITLVAHDWGGAIGMGAAVAAPERFARLRADEHGRLSRRALPAGDPPVPRAAVGQLAVQGLNLFARAALRSAVEHHERMTPAVRAGLPAPYDSWRNRVAIHRFVHDIPLRPSHPSYATLAEIEAGLASSADKPVCLIWGMRDWCFAPGVSRPVSRFLSAAEVHRLADAGHYVVEDAHERIVPLMEDFLANCQSSLLNCRSGSRTIPIANRHANAVSTSASPTTIWSSAPPISSPWRAACASRSTATITAWRPRSRARWTTQQYVVDFLAVREAAAGDPRGVGPRRAAAHRASGLALTAGPEEVEVRWADRRWVFPRIGLPLAAAGQHDGRVVGRCISGGSCWRRCRRCRASGRESFRSRWKNRRGRGRFGNAGANEWNLQGAEPLWELFGGIPI